LREAGIDPMAIRLALLAHRHDVAWEWHDEELGAANERLAGWRAGFTRATGPAAGPLIASLREALRSGLDTPAALRAVDAWAAATGDDRAAPGEAAVAVDALLGIT
jgi:L-cysteine:1D-myo-inositol 2-amino-2-deoxy-alpha-D-glucopyranoside ligase